MKRRHSQRVSPFYHVALHMSSVVDFHVNCHELHQDSLHCHQVLEEEHDDWCHCWYFQNGTALSCCSPDSWWRRLNVVNASLKSERSLTGPIFPDLLREIHQFCIENTLILSCNERNLNGTTEAREFVLLSSFTSFSISVCHEVVPS